MVSTAGQEIEVEQSQSERIRRSPHVFFSLDEQFVLDIAQLVSGRLPISHATQIVAHSILTEQLYPLTLDDLRLLLQLPTDQWTLLSDIVLTCNATVDRVRELTYMGIIMSDRAGPLLTKLKQRDELLSAQHWDQHALLYHTFGKWRGVKAERMPESHRDMPPLEIISSYFGKPPPHFHSISSPLETVDLPLIERQGSLYKTLAQRRTTRIFDRQRPVTMEELSTILYYVWGCHGYLPVADDTIGIKRTSPSGGDLHPIEVYPMISHVRGLSPGWYHYNVEHHRLDQIIRLNQAEVASWIEELTAGQWFFAEAHAVFVMTARFPRTFWKYRRHRRAYAVTLMDAAHLSQTFYLVCTELGLGPFVTAAINAGDIDERLALDGISESAILMCGCGKPLEQRGALQPEFQPYVPRRTKLPAQVRTSLSTTRR